MTTKCKTNLFQNQIKMPFKIPNLEYFIGSWIYQREFDNGTWGTGLAEFKQNEDFLNYSEKGELILSNGQKLKSARQYLYKFQEKGFDIYFFEDQKSLFQSVKLKLKNGIYNGIATHFCSNDVYVSQYSFFKNGSFEIVHNVKGPKKNYISKTVFYRE